MMTFDINNDEELAGALHTTLNDTFHLSAFRAGQYDALVSLFRQQRLLCIQPTGHGKSLLYQLPTVLLPGITIVFSPLLALMRDQIQQLRERFHIPAASINSDQSEEENDAVQHYALNGELKILFIAPEKLDNLHYFDFLFQLPITLVVVDEAHCISTWGHDFRPSYRQILHFIRKLSEQSDTLRILAITATANQKTEQDIIHQLGHEHQAIQVQRQSMNRPNLQLDIHTAASFAEKLLILKQLLQQLKGHGLIYCSTRDNTEMVARFLQPFYPSVVAYHAGLTPALKRQIQQGFIQNHYQTVVATNALGMGIDKADVRYIIHFDVVGSITAYYQEVGRAGRDGLPAHGVLLFDEQDKKIQTYFIDSAQPQPADFEAMMRAITHSEVPPILTDLKRQTGMHPTRVNIVLSELVEQAFIKKSREGGRQVYKLTANNSAVDLSRYQRQQAIREHELDEILKYSSSLDLCLMGRLRRALGDLEVDACGQCCVCKPSMFNILRDAEELRCIDHWLAAQTVAIDLGAWGGCETGMAVLDAKLRSPLFIEFMKNRSQADACMNTTLWQLIKPHVLTLQQHAKCSAIVVIPSRTWLGRDFFAKQLADILNIPVYLDLLSWKNIPQHRQGECLNNDQRKFNVTDSMTAQRHSLSPTGSILLLDDYVGSGVTLKEAARALKKEGGYRGKIHPFTIAAVKWRLGRSGMV
ncbi:MAG: RecQ family ATP-dependent DNA helicase [Gammaproteobacteria bacterium]|nr:RecQ family ATP-dependent DNA helicase [Gammaproteobacteria bacterium]